MASPMKEIRAALIRTELHRIKLAAYRAGVEAAAKACEADAGRYCEAHPWSASDQRAVQAFDAGYTSGAYGGAKAARAVPDPAPEQMEEIK